MLRWLRRRGVYWAYLPSSACSPPGPSTGAHDVLNESIAWGSIGWTDLEANVRIRCPRRCEGVLVSVSGVAKAPRHPRDECAGRDGHRAEVELGEPVAGAGDEVASPRSTPSARWAVSVVEALLVVRGDLGGNVEVSERGGGPYRVVRAFGSTANGCMDRKEIMTRHRSPHSRRLCSDAEHQLKRT